MRPTLLQHLSGWLPILPAFVALLFRQRQSAARLWIVAWCLLIVARNAAMLALGTRGINNLWLIYVSQPIAIALIVWAFQYWQPDEQGRRALRLALPVVVGISIALVFAFENPQTFSIVASPFHFLTILFVALWTFVRLSVRVDDSLAGHDWFWISGGLMLSAASATALGPLAWYLLQPRVDLLHAMLNVASAADVLAYAAITRGMLCQRRPNYSGGSSSPRLSPSSSSSLASP